MILATGKATHPRGNIHFVRIIQIKRFPGREQSVIDLSELPRNNVGAIALSGDDVGAIALSGARLAWVPIITDARDRLLLERQADRQLRSPP